MDEPINDRRELNESEKRNGEFLVSRADAPVAFETAEEVFDFMAPPIVAAMKGQWPTARAPSGDIYPRTLSAQARPKSVGIETSIGDCAALAQVRQERLNSIKIVTLALG